MTFTGAASPRARKKLNVATIMLEGRALVALVVIIVLFSFLSDTYLSMDNLIVMTRHVAINAIIALGMLMVILTGGIDLSVGSIVGLSGVVAGALLQGWSLSIFDVVAYPKVWVVVILSLTVGTFAGYINGILVTRFRVAPFVATLGMMYVARGAAMLLADGKTFPKLRGNPELGNTGFITLGQGRFLNIPMGVWIMVVMAILAWLLLAKTSFGRWVYAVGGNERAAELSGVPVKLVHRRVYAISGFAAGIVGLILASELTAATPQTGETYELNAIAAVVIGGAALSGGRGTVRGTLIGAFVIGFLSDGLVSVQVSTFWQMVIKGIVIVAAVALDQFQQNLKRPTESGSGPVKSKRIGQEANPAKGRPSEEKVSSN